MSLKQGNGLNDHKLLSAPFSVKATTLHGAHLIFCFPGDSPAAFLWCCLRSRPHPSHKQKMFVDELSSQSFPAQLSKASSGAPVNNNLADLQQRQLQKVTTRFCSLSFQTSRISHVVLRRTSYARHFGLLQVPHQPSAPGLSDLKFQFQTSKKMTSKQQQQDTTTKTNCCLSRNPAIEMKIGS